MAVNYMAQEVNHEEKQMNLRANGKSSLEEVKRRLDMIEKKLSRADVLAGALHNLCDAVNTIKRKVVDVKTSRHKEKLSRINEDADDDDDKDDDSDKSVNYYDNDQWTSGTK